MFIKKLILLPVLATSRLNFQLFLETPGWDEISSCLWKICDAGTLKVSRVQQLKQFTKNSSLSRMFLPLFIIFWLEKNFHRHIPQTKKQIIPFFQIFEDSNFLIFTKIHPFRSTLITFYLKNENMEKWDSWAQHWIFWPFI